MMKTIELIPGLEASEIGLGCMRINELDTKAAESLVKTALDLGITLFDNADIYGGDEPAEEVFGRVMGAHPELRGRMVIQSKCGIRGDYYDFSKEHILKTVEQSLRRMRIDHLDVLLLHRPDALVEPEEVAEAFAALEKDGKVRAFGVSNHNPMQIELLKTAVRSPLVANQLQFSPLRAGMVRVGLNVNTQYDDGIDRDGSILDYSRIHHMVVQPWSPLQQGQIEGTFLGVQGYKELNTALEELGEQYGLAPNAMVIAWILRHPAGMMPIVGTMDETHLKEIAKASGVRISRSDWYKLYAAAGNRII